MSLKYSSFASFILLLFTFALTTSKPHESYHSRRKRSPEQGRRLQSVDESLCQTTTSGTSWGGDGDDFIVDADTDDEGNIYVVGETISSDYASSQQDIFIFKLTTAFVIEWGKSWGGTKIEYATAISANKDSNDEVYVTGYTNSPALVYAKEDSFVIKMDGDGDVVWEVRIGFDQIDYILGMMYYKGYLYMVGSTSSTGWTSADTDMLFMKVGSSDNSFSWLYSLGGVQDEQTVDIFCHTDGYCYSIGDSSSIALTDDNSIDIFFFKISYSGTLSFAKHYGGINPEYADGIAVYGDYVYLTGYSLSDGLTNGLNDIFIVAATTDGAYRWAKYIGTTFYDEYPHGLAVSQTGNVYFTGTLSSVDYTYGQDDVLIVGITAKGTEIYTQNIGGELKESPGAIVYSSYSERLQVVMNTQSDELGNGVYDNSLSSNGGYDFVGFDLDEWGTNQCKELNINNLTYSDLELSTADKSYTLNDIPVTLTFKTISTTSAKSVISGTVRTLSTAQTDFCESYFPILPSDTELEDETVIQNTYLYYQLYGFCEVEGAELTYTLEKEDGSDLDDWMIFNDESLIVQGLVPKPNSDSETFVLIGTDDENNKLKAYFTIYYLSTPYLNKELEDVSLRTEQSFSYTIPEDTFLQPNNLPLTYNISNYPDWMTLQEKARTLYGVPSSSDQGTYTIVVFVEDTNGQNASTTFQVAVEKNYAPVTQMRIDDYQLDTDTNFTLTLDNNLFVDPNGDYLTIKTSDLPSWLHYDSKSKTFYGVPTVMGNYTIEITASDAWGSSASVSFTIYTGKETVYGPLVGTLLEDQIGYESILLVYKFPDDIFIPQTEPDLTIYVTGVNGTVLPEWLSYEEVSMTLSGTPNSTTEPTEIFVTADDRRGGYAFQSFKITEIILIQEEEISYLELIIVAGALGGFIFFACVFLCCKNIKCRCCRSVNEDDDSFEDDDDVCVEEAKPKNPFKLQEEIHQKAEKTKGMHRDNRFQVYNKQLDSHVRVLKPVMEEE